jgi:MFS transporter, ACS family, D-galactonate transporter
MEPQSRTIMGKINSVKPTKRRWFMLGLICMVIGLNYLDRGNLAVAAPVMQKELGINAATMGVLFSAFAWSYAFCLPFAGALLDRFGPRIMFTVAIIGWSVSTFCMGLTNSLTKLLGVRAAVGVFEAPIIPTNVRCVAAWFPDRERALAVGAYTGMEYFALGFLTPLLSWVLVTYGWQMIFYGTGAIGIVVALIWHYNYKDPAECSDMNEAEMKYIKEGGALVESGVAKGKTVSWTTVGKLFRQRKLIGMFIGHFSIMTTLFFFLTWFPSYLITAKGLTILKGGFYAMFPFLVAIVGSLVGGKWSDWMTDHGYSKTISRKTPIIAGFFMSAVIMGANYFDNINGVIACMAVAFFGQAMASTVTGALLSDIAPKDLLGISGGLLNFIANIGSATSPMIVGFIVQGTGGFNMALAYVSLVSVCGICAYLFVLTKVERIVLDEE